jgi:hypothetical protein
MASIEVEGLESVVLIFLLAGESPRLSVESNTIAAWK